MSNQVGGITTNLAKLVSWDIDTVDSLDDTEGCLVCLTPREKYVLGQALEQAQWNTRWTSELGTVIPEYRAQLISQLVVKMSQESCINICEQMIICIETDDDVKNALSNYLSINQTAGYGTPNGADSEILTLQILDGTMCDPDNIFAMVTQLTDYLNTLIEDFFEALESTTYLLETIGTVLRGVPILETLPFDEIVVLWENFISQAGTGYLAAYNTSVRDYIRCSIFCLVLDNDCLFDWQLLAGWFADQAQQELFTIDLQDLLDYLTQGIFAGTEWVYAMHWFMIGVLSLASKFLDQTADKLVKVIAAASNDTDSDWSIICDDCPVTATLEALQLTEQLSPLTIAYGNYNSSIFTVTQATISGSTSGVRVDFTLPVGAILTNARIKYGSKSVGESRQNRILDGVDGTGTILASETPNANQVVVDQDMIFSGSHEMTTDNLRFSINVATNAGSGSYVNALEVECTYSYVP